MIRVLLPPLLQRLTNSGREVEVQVDGPVTQRSVLDALEARYPALRGTIRDRATQERRALIRFFACGRDVTLEPPDAPLPEAIVNGVERFMIVGAIAGG